MAIKRIQLRGISHSPSDNMSADGGCDESINFFLNQEELAPMDKMLAVSADIIPHSIEGIMEIVFIHKTSSYKHTIHALHSTYGTYNAGLYHIEDETYVWNLIMAFNSGEELKKIEAIGNTLIVLTNQRMVYILYKNEEYNLLGSKLPEVMIDVIQNSVTPTSQYISNTINYKDVLGTDAYVLQALQSLTGSDGLTITKDNFNTWTERKRIAANNLFNIINNNINTNLRKIAAETNALPQPVFIRYALRLYDGTYAMHSAPILIDPSRFEKDRFIGFINLHFVDDYGEQTGTNIHTISFSTTGTNEMRACTISFVINNVSEMDDWKDIIQSIDIFSTPVFNRLDGVEFDRVYDAVMEYPYPDKNEGTSKLCLKEKSNDRITENSLFYKIMSFNIDEYLGICGKTIGHSDRTKTIDNYLMYYDGSLVVKDLLNDDTVNTRMVYTPNNMQTFNERLLTTDITTKYSHGYYDKPSEKTIVTEGVTYQYYIKYFITNEDGAAISVIKEYTNNYTLGPWLFYPDSRCTQADVYLKMSSGNNFAIYKRTVLMKEDDYLNGAYFFAGWNLSNSFWPETSVESIDMTMHDTIRINNVLFQYISQNPFIVNYKRRFSSKVISVAPLTAPLSQGQFGYADLYVFTEDGIYTLAATADGSLGAHKYLSSSVAFPGTICQLEQAIAFVSSRGLMLLVGSQIRCLSDKMASRSFIPTQLNGLDTLLQNDNNYKIMKDAAMDTMSFFEFIKDCVTVHDVAGNRILMFKKFASGNVKGYCYVYDFTTDSFSKCLTPRNAAGTDVFNFSRSINSYPNAVVTFKKTNGEFYTASCNKSNSLSRGGALSVNRGLLITRSLNLDDTYARKRINAIRIRGTWVTDTSAYSSSVQYILYGSMDGNTWARVTSLHGSSCKFYRIVVLSTLKPWDRISWIDVDYSVTMGGRIM